MVFLGDEDISVCYLVPTKVRLLLSHRNWEIYMVYMSLPGHPSRHFSCHPSRISVAWALLSGVPLRWHPGKGREDGQALMPKLLPPAAAAGPGTLLPSNSRSAAGVGWGDRPVQLVPRQLWGPGQGRCSSPSRQKPLIHRLQETRKRQRVGGRVGGGGGPHPHVYSRGPTPNPLPCLLRMRRPAWALCTCAHSMLAGYRAASRQQASVLGLRQSWQLKGRAQSPILYPRTDLIQVLYRQLPGQILPLGPAPGTGGVSTCQEGSAASSPLPVLSDFPGLVQVTQLSMSC